MELCSIASGSSGNCIYVGNQNTKLLIDTGISGKRIEQGLSLLNLNPKEIDGILITHEHSDHIRGLGVMVRRYHLPVYATLETILLIEKNIGQIPKHTFQEIKPDQAFFIKDININPFSVPHDAKNPVCYTFCSNGHKIGIATDLGNYNDYIISHLKDSEILLLEANHDIHMLEVGSYPYALKRRILGEYGHLSNDTTGRLLGKLLHKGLKYILLGHLSKENNYPQLAYETVKYELMKQEKIESLTLLIAGREAPSEKIVI